MDEDLNELDQLFSEIGGNEKLEENSGGFDEFEDGDYEAEIISAEWTKSKADIPMVKIEFGIAGKNGHIWDYLMFGHKDQDRQKVSQAVSRSVTKLRELGLDGTTITDYVNQLDKLEGVRLTLTLETSKSGFQNKHYSNVQ